MGENIRNMKWDNININNITDKILYLKELMQNSNKTNEEDYNIINALIAGSKNPISGEHEYGFTIQLHHIDYLKKLWDITITQQNNENIIEKIKENY